MGKLIRLTLALAASIAALSLFGGCGTNNPTSSAPTVATVFYAHNALVFKPAGFQPYSTVRTWGYNGYGQLGNGQFFNGDGGKQIVNIPNVAGVSVGGNHTLAFSNNSTVQAWGYNFYGQLGNNTTTSSNTKVPVLAAVGGAQLDGITQVSAGGQHSLALKNDATVWAWGYNAFGQLGNNTQINSSIAIPVQDSSGVDLNGVKEIAAGGYHSLALKNNGEVWAWGDNAYGQLGDNSTTIRTRAVKVVDQGGSAIIANHIAAGGSSSFALNTTNNVLWVWGYNFFGQLGDGTFTDRHVATRIDLTSRGIAGASAVSSGVSHTLLLAGGKVWAWGYNLQGQLGLGTFTDGVNAPVPVMFNGQQLGSAGAVDAIYAIGQRSLVTLNNGTSVLVWGRNNYGELGVGIDKIATPTPLPN